MDKCEICQKETDELIECANCGIDVCSDCYENEGSWGVNPGVNLCSKCLEALAICEECENHIPDEFLKTCDICRDLICEDCFDNHVEKCEAERLERSKQWTIERPMNELKFTWFDYDGNEVLFGKHIPHLFKVEGEGFKTEEVLKIVLPPIDYSLISNTAMVKIYGRTLR